MTQCWLAGWQAWIREPATGRPFARCVVIKPDVSLLQTWEIVSVRRTSRSWSCAVRPEKLRSKAGRGGQWGRWRADGRACGGERGDPSGTGEGRAGARQAHGSGTGSGSGQGPGRGPGGGTRGGGVRGKRAWPKGSLRRARLRRARLRKLGPRTRSWPEPAGWGGTRMRGAGMSVRSRWRASSSGSSPSSGWR